MTSGPWVPPERTFSSLVPTRRRCSRRQCGTTSSASGTSSGARRHARASVPAVPPVSRPIRSRRSSDSTRRATSVTTTSRRRAASSSTAGALRRRRRGSRVASRRAWTTPPPSPSGRAAGSRGPVRRVAPSVLRPSGERIARPVHGTLDADLPETRTRVTLMYRVSARRSVSRTRAPGRPPTAASTSRSGRPCRIGRPAAASSTCSSPSARLMRDPRERGVVLRRAPDRRAPDCASWAACR